MDKQMYDLIKQAMKDGKSMDDVIAEVNAMAEAAKKEIKPKFPLQEKYGNFNPRTDVYSIALNSDGSLYKPGVISVLARYYVQNGLNPDLCFDSEESFLKQIAVSLEAQLSSIKIIEKLGSLKKSGASEQEIGETAVDEIIDMVFDKLFDSKN